MITEIRSLSLKISVNEVNDFSSVGFDATICLYSEETSWWVLSAMLQMGEWLKSGYSICRRTTYCSCAFRRIPRIKWNRLIIAERWVESDGFHSLSMPYRIMPIFASLFWKKTKKQNKKLGLFSNGEISNEVNRTHEYSVAWVSFRSWPNPFSSLCQTETTSSEFIKSRRRSFFLLTYWMSNVT